MRFKTFYIHENKQKSIRFEIGKKLTSKEKTELFKNIGDVYKDNNLNKEYKGIDARGEEMYGYMYKPEYFLTSDITRKKIRYYIVLPDKRIVHPSEIYSNITKSSIDNEMLEREKKEKNKKEEEKRILDIADDANSLTDANLIYNKLYGLGGDKYHKNFVLFVKNKKHIKIPDLKPWKNRQEFLKRKGFKVALINKNGDIQQINPDIIIHGSSPSQIVIKKYFGE